MSVTFKELGALGRLGNQLFQISALVGHARTHNMDWIIPKWKYAQFFNGPFNIVENLPEFETYHEKHFHYQNIPYYKDVNLSGYFQSRRYFEHCEKEIKKMFTFDVDILSQVKNTLEAIKKHTGDKTLVFVHFRRGDYVTTMSHYYHEMTWAWYSEAMSKFDPEKHHFIIVSDDIGWVERNLPGNFTFSRGNEIHDLCLMSQCSHGIMCNSSFSWWGGYLIDNPDKRIIAPAKDKWFKPVAGHNVESLYMDSWILI